MKPKKQLKVANREIADLKMRLRLIGQTHDSLLRQRDDWRRRYELAQLTPEVKADTEAAYLRGAAAARRQVLAFLHDALNNMETPVD